MKHLLLTTLLSAFLFTSCHNEFICEKPNGYSETKEYHLSDVTGIRLVIRGNVIITKGEIQKVEVVAQDEIHNNLNTFVENGTWNITMDKCFMSIFTSQYPHWTT